MRKKLVFFSMYHFLYPRDGNDHSTNKMGEWIQNGRWRLAKNFGLDNPKINIPEMVNLFNGSLKSAMEFF